MNRKALPRTAGGPFTSAASSAGESCGKESGAAAPDSLWYALVPVPRGRHRYKFLVDGNRWIADPANPQQSGDGSGGIASVLDVR